MLVTVDKHTTVANTTRKSLAMLTRFLKGRGNWYRMERTSIPQQHYFGPLKMKQHQHQLAL